MRTELLERLERTGLLDKLEAEAVAERDAERLRLAAELREIEAEYATARPEIQERRETVRATLAEVRREARETVRQAEREHAATLNECSETESSYTGRAHRLRRRLHTLRDERIDEVIRSLRGLQAEIRSQPPQRWSRILGYDRYGAARHVVETDSAERGAELAELHSICCELDAWLDYDSVTLDERVDEIVARWPRLAELLAGAEVAPRESDDGPPRRSRYMKEIHSGRKFFI